MTDNENRGRHFSETSIVQDLKKHRIVAKDNNGLNFIGIVFPNWNCIQDIIVKFTIERD